MGTYIYTFRTEKKRATFWGKPIEVSAYRYLCRMGDEDPGFFRRSSAGRRSQLLQANIDRASDLFSKARPKYVAIVGDTWHEGAEVYCNPRGAIWYDCDEAPGKIAGFLVKAGSQWTISQKRARVDNPLIATYRVECRYVEEIVEGMRHTHSFSYTVLDRQLTQVEYDKWKEEVEAAYARDLQRKKTEEAARMRMEKAERAVKRAALDAQIQGKRGELEELERARRQIG
jgi:hypothetical protein